MQAVQCTPRASVAFAKAAFNLMVLASMRCERADQPKSQQVVYRDCTASQSCALFERSVEDLRNVAKRAKR